MKLKISFLGLIFILCTSKIMNAAQLDFSWGAPKTYVHNKGTAGEVMYINGSTIFCRYLKMVTPSQSS